MLQQLDSQLIHLTTTALLVLLNIFNFFRIKRLENLKGIKDQLRERGILKQRAKREKKLTL